MLGPTWLMHGFEPAWASPGEISCSDNMPIVCRRAFSFLRTKFPDPRSNVLTVPLAQHHALLTGMDSDEGRALGRALRPDQALGSAGGDHTSVLGNLSKKCGRIALINYG
jgi:hypothetical protein